MSVYNFRGIRSAEWVLPRQRFICLVGPGDSTKTTLLDAVTLVLSPRWSVQFTDADFHLCDASQPIRLQVVVGDLNEPMLADTAFGLNLSGLATNGELVHDPVDGAEACVVLQLAVNADLEPDWTVVRPGSIDDGQPIGATKRRALGVFRVDDRVDAHLRWGRGSALTQLTEANGASQAVTLAGRAARTAVFSAPNSALHATAEQVSAAASAIGGAAYFALQPGWDPAASASSSALLLHEGTIPLTHAGLGTRRLTSIAAQEIAAAGGDILLVDEVEHGLEPHRLLHLLNRVKQRAMDGRGQVIMTTHSPITVQALQAADMCIARSTSGDTTVLPVPDAVNEIQGALRSCPAAVLSRKVIICEGKTEVGITRQFIRFWDQERLTANLATHAALGVAFTDGGGNPAPVRAKVFRDLGFATLLLVDNDDRSVDADVSAAASAAVVVVRWEHGNSTEAEVTSTLDVSGLRDLLQVAAQLHGEESVRDAIVNRLPSVASPGQLDPQSWLNAGHTLDDLRQVIGEVAHKKSWFKREDFGEALGDFLLNHWNGYKGTALGQRIDVLRRFVYES